MGKKILIGFTILLIVGLLTGWYFFTREAKYFGTPSFNAIPENGSIIVRIHHIGDYAARSLKNPVWKTYSGFTGISDLYQNLIFVDSLFRMNPTLGKAFFNKDLTMVLGSEKDKMGNLCILELSSLGEKRTLSGIIENYLAQKGAAIEKLKTGSANVIHYFWNEGTVRHQIYMTFYYGLFMAGNEPELISSAVAELENPDKTRNSVFEKANKTATDNIDVNIYLNHKQMLRFWPNLLEDGFLKQINGSFSWAEWSEIDLTQKNEELLLNGFSFTGDSLHNYLEIFLHQKPGTFNLAGFIPASTSFFLGVSIGDNQQFFKDYERFLKHQNQLSSYKSSLHEIDSLYSIDIQNIVINNLEGAAAMVFTQPDLANHEENKFLLFKVKSGTQIEEAMTPLFELPKVRTKKGSSHTDDLFKIDNEVVSKIYKISVADFGKRVFGGLFADVRTDFFTVYNNCLIMGASSESLTSFLRANVLQETLGNNKSYQEFASSLSEQYNFYFWGSPGSCLPFFKGKINGGLYEEFENKMTEIHKIESVGWQVGIENGLAYNMARIKYDSVNQEIGPSPVWRSLIGTPLVSKLQYVVNPSDRARQEIVVQDSASNFMLLGNQGSVLWKIKLDGPILSDIYQLNCFKDGQLQFFFSTGEALHMIDHDGNYIRNYPLSLRSPATNGVSVFDYDKNGDYRFFIAGKDHRVYLYDKKGNIVPDWAPGKTEHDVTQPVQFFRVENKDYLVFADSNHGYILDRKGKPRVILKGDRSYSNNRFYLKPKSGKNAARLITTGSDGQVFSFGFDGTVTTSSFGKFSPEHYFCLVDLNSDNNPDYFFLDGKKLIAYDPKGDEIFSKELSQPANSAPVIFTFTDRNPKIGITVRSENKLFLFNSDGSLYPGFPLIGNSTFKINFLENPGGSFNLITGTPDGYLNNYQMK